MEKQGTLDRLLNQIAQLAEEGTLGPEAQASAAEYEAFPNDIARAVKYLADFYVDEDETSQARDILTQVLIVAYRDAKKNDPDLAKSFANAFITDFPGTTGTALLPRWTSLAEACYGLKAVAHSDNRSMIWQHSSRLVLNMNEFLDGLIGFLIIAWRCAIGRATNANVLGNAYGSKVHEFGKLTNAEDGVFYLIFRLAKPKLRNALAHGGAWPDYDAGLVRFTEGGQDGIEHEISIVDFMAFTKLGCDLARSYVASLAAIIVLEDGGKGAISLMPRHLVTLWNK